jgi:hypothetical protein
LKKKPSAAAELGRLREEKSSLELESFCLRDAIRDCLHQFPEEMESESVYMQAVKRQLQDALAQAWREQCRRWKVPKRDCLRYMPIEVGSRTKVTICNERVKS